MPAAASAWPSASVRSRTCEPLKPRSFSGSRCGVATTRVTPSATNTRAISRLSARSAAPSSAPGRMWLCRSIMSGSPASHTSASFGPQLSRCSASRSRFAPSRCAKAGPASPVRCALAPSPKWRRPAVATLGYSCHRRDEKEKATELAAVPAGGAIFGDVARRRDGKEKAKIGEAAVPGGGAAFRLPHHQAGRKGEGQKGRLISARVAVNHPSVIPHLHRLPVPTVAACFQRVDTPEGPPRPFSTCYVDLWIPRASPRLFDRGTRTLSTNNAASTARRPFSPGVHKLFHTFLHTGAAVRSPANRHPNYNATSNAWRGGERE